MLSLVAALLGLGLIYDDTKPHLAHQVGFSSIAGLLRISPRHLADHGFIQWHNIRDGSR